MDIPPFIELPFRRENPVSAQDSAEDKYPESFPRYFIERLTGKGDKVIDPFMGHGTTALVAEALGRIPYGVEADEDRYGWTCAHMKQPENVYCADAGDCKLFGWPKMDFCVTSPPFMAKNHIWNPLYAGDRAYSGYDRYLLRMGEIFSALKGIMKKNAVIVVHADNIHGRIYTPLVRDFSILIGEHFRPAGETVIQWQGAATPAGYTHSHALIFKNA